jgi:hypothetical protein
MLFKNFDSKSLLENYKFEIKKAKDIHQRLDDVKYMKLKKKLRISLR